LSPEVCPEAPAIGHSRGEWERYEHSCADREARALAKWLEPVPWALFVTVAPLAPVGPGTYGWLADDLLDLVGVQTGLPRRSLGLLGFTQRNKRGGLHAHELVAGPEELRGLHRVTLARACEARWADVQPQRLDYEVRQAMRVDVQLVRGPADVVAYCVRYAGRECEGDMFERGRGLSGWGL
jgi:hypothetical protein